MNTILRALLVYVLLAAIAQAELSDYFRNPKGLYVSTSVISAFKTKVSELDFRGDNTFTWKEYVLIQSPSQGVGILKIIGHYDFNVNGKWVLPVGTVSIALEALNLHYLFILDGGDLIEQQGDRRRFVKKNNAEAN